jgi:integrase
VAHRSGDQSTDPFLAGSNRCRCDAGDVSRLRRGQREVSWDGPTRTWRSSCCYQSRAPRSANHAHGGGQSPRKTRWLTRSEAAALLLASLREPRVRLYLPLFILIGLYTGQRKEAILSLRWAQVDLANARVDFNSPGARRTNKRRARIPIPSKLLPHLRRARFRGAELGFVVHDSGARIQDVKRGFASACRRAGLENVTPHTLRHTCATWLMQRGVSLWDAAGVPRHEPRNIGTGVRSPPP